MFKSRKLISLVGVLSLIFLALSTPAYSAPTRKTQLTAPKNILVEFPNDTETNNVRVTWSNVANNQGYAVRIYGSAGKALQTISVSPGILEQVFSFPFNRQYRVSVQTLGTGSFSNSPESGKYSFTTNLTAVITNQPSGAVNGLSLTSQPIIRIAYPSGNTVSGFSGDVTSSIASGSGTLSGTTTRAAVSGVATFDDLVITGTAGEYALTFSPVGASAVTSNSFVLVPVSSSSLITNGPFTIRFWVKPTEQFMNGSRKELVSLVTDGGTNRFDIWYSPGEGSDWALYFDQPASNFLVHFYDLDLITPVIGNWYEVVVTRDASNKLHFYFDSIESSYQPVSSLDLTAYENILIGADPYYWNNPSAAGQGDAYISQLQIINGVALKPTSDFASETARTTFLLKNFIDSNNSLVLTPTSYFAFSNGELSARPTGGTPLYSTELPVLAVGRTGQGGGTVFYYDASGFACGPTLSATCHYLEAAPTNGSAAWLDSLNKWSDTSVQIGSNAEGTAIGTGYKNTEAMVAQSSTAGNAGIVVREYRGPNNLSDWFLPSRAELNELCKYASGQTTGVTAEVCAGGTLRAGFTASWYWSSSENSATPGDSWMQNFSSGLGASQAKWVPWSVRPIRAF